MRKLTTFEKAQFLNLPFFQDVCEIEALEVAKFWVDYIPKEGDNLEELSKVKVYSGQLLSTGSVDKLTIVKTWLVLNDQEMEVVEKEDYGLQLVETTKAMLADKEGKPSAFRNVMQKTIIKKSEAIVDAPVITLDGIKEATVEKAWWNFWS